MGFDIFSANPRFIRDITRSTVDTVNDTALIGSWSLEVSFVSDLICHNNIPNTLNDVMLLQTLLFIGVLLLYHLGHTEQQPRHLFLCINPF